MKKGLILLKILLLLAVFSAMVSAQNTVSLTSGGFIVVSGESPGTPVSTQPPNGKLISAQINFGNVTQSSNSSRQIVKKMLIRISSTVAYKIEFQRFSLDDNAVKPSEIGFGITNIRAQMLGAKDLKDNVSK